MFAGPFSSSLKRGPSSKLWHYRSDSPQLPALYFATVMSSCQEERVSREKCLQRIEVCSCF